MANISARGVRHAIFLPVYLLIVTGLLLVILAITTNGATEDAKVPIALAGLLCGYLAWEVRREIVGRGAVALLSPAVLASLVHFYMSYSMPALGMSFDDHIFRLVAFWTEDEQVVDWITYAMILVCISAFAFWRGYRFILWRAIAGPMKCGLRRFVKREMKINMPIVIILAAVSVGARLIQVSLGVFGYASETDALYEFAAYRSYLDYAASIGIFVLFLIAWQTFKRRQGQNLNLWIALIADMLLEITFGFLAGFKGQVIMPAIAIGAAYFMVRGRLPTKWAIAAVILFVAAYSIVEPFRHIRNTNSSFSSTSISSIWDALQTAASGASDSNYISRNWFGVLLQRSEIVSTTSTAIRYKDIVQELGPDAPDFLGYLVLAPAYAFIPRLVWPEKPIAAFGRWFDYQVLGGARDGRNSVGMGPVGYFYFAGGIAGVIFGFFGLGVFYRAWFETLTSLGAGGWIVYFTILSPLAAIYSEVGTVLAGVLQQIPLAILLQAVVLKSGHVTRIGPQVHAHTGPVLHP